MVRLGDLARDKVTGFEGIVIGITEYLYNCRRPILQPRGLDSNGKTIDSQAFDEDQLDIVTPGVISSKRTPVEHGGPLATPTRRVDPR